jgi:outer membrane protein assembly factor BamB
VETGLVRCVRYGLILAAVLLAGCSSGSDDAQTAAPATTGAQASTTASSPAPTSSPNRRGIAGWPTYHGTTDRAGVSPSPPLTPPLRTAWTTHLDGAVYAQPLVVGPNVIVATENNSVYALEAATGRVRWHHHLAEPVPQSNLPCGNIDPLGITGTPAYDAATGLLFLVTESGDAVHDLHALDARTGQPRWERNLDVVDRDRHAEQQRAAVLVAHHRVYTAFGGLYGDCGDYIGYVTAVATDGSGPVLHYAVPSGREAGIWAPPGPVEEASGDLLVAAGNGSSTGGDFDGSDSVIRLSPDLQRLAVFAPSSWPEDNAADLDLGSSSPVPVAGHIVIAGKRGTAYLLPPSLGGVGGEVATLDGCASYGGAATVGTAVVLPCSDGIRRLDVTGSTMRWRWQLTDAAGSPLIAGDTVYALSPESGDLYAVDLDTGQVRSHVHVGEVTRFATPAPAGRLIVVGTTSGVVAVSGR